MGVGGGGGGQKGPPYQFFPCNFYKRRNWPSELSDFSFNPFATLVQNIKFLPSASPKFLNLNQDHPHKKSDFSGQILIKLRL